MVCHGSFEKTKKRYSAAMSINREITNYNKSSDDRPLEMHLAIQKAALEISRFQGPGK
jgi:hypothetical protein